MNLSDNIARYIRVGVTLAVGFLVTWLASTVHVVIGPSSEAALVALTVSVVSAAYYALARFIEKKWPSIGKYLLGAPSGLPSVVTLKGDGSGTMLPPITPEPTATKTPGSAG